MSDPATDPRSSPTRPAGPSGPWAAPVAATLGAALLWAYRPTLAAIAQRWSEDNQYSHGYVVPVFAAVVLWVRRRDFPAGALRPTAWGLAFLAAAAAVRLTGAYYYLDGLDAFSLVVAVVGVGLLAAGWPLWRWGWPAVVFLLLMVPLPYQADVLVTGPLLGVAVRTSTYALQTLGLPAYAEGNVILIDDLTIGVLEACSGLGMLRTFVAISAAVALAIDRPLRDRAVVLASAVPVGILMNCLRITVTALLYRTVGGEAAQTFFHDLAGWFMMPLAFGVLWLELRLMTALFVATGPGGPASPAPPAGQESSAFPAAAGGRPGAPIQAPLLEVSDAVS
jgi:exosortase